jgi:hypothetical protein
LFTLSKFPPYSSSALYKFHCIKKRGRDRSKQIQLLYDCRLSLSATRRLLRPCNSERFQHFRGTHYLPFSGPKQTNKNNNLRGSVREQTIPTELPLLVGKISATFFFCGIAWSAQQIPTAVFSGFQTGVAIFFFQVATQLYSGG